MEKDSLPNKKTASACILRKGTREDIPQVLGLIQELALYEKAPYEVENTVEQMLIDGFGEKPIFDFFVAEPSPGKIVGIALYYFRYSTWKGRRLYLEDLIVTEQYRGQGLGKMLFEAIIQEAKATRSHGVVWQVLDWNEPAIQFYKRYGASFDGEWINCSLKV
ncbi:MAG: GNAT family N-acetyltransferase [Bacteroidota bacterium]